MTATLAVEFLLRAACQADKLIVIAGLANAARHRRPGMVGRS